MRDKDIQIEIRFREGEREIEREGGDKRERKICGERGLVEISDRLK